MQDKHRFPNWEDKCLEEKNRKGKNLGHVECISALQAQRFFALRELITGL